MDEVSEKPSVTQTGIELLYASMVLGVVNGMLQWRFLPGPGLFKFFVLVFTLGLLFLCIRLIGKRKNWARITFLVLFLLGLPSTFWSVPRAFNMHFFIGLISIAVGVCQLIAIIMLFQKASNNWFKRPGISNA